MYPLSTFAIGMYAPMVRGALVARGSPSAADVTSAMSAALPYEFGQDASLLPPYLRGLAYMAAHAPDLALVEFQKLIDHVGIDPVSPLFAMSFSASRARTRRWASGTRVARRTQRCWISGSTRNATRRSCAKRSGKQRRCGTEKRRRPEPHRASGARSGNSRPELRLPLLSGFSPVRDSSPHRRAQRRACGRAKPSFATRADAVCAEDCRGGCAQTGSVRGSPHYAKGCRGTPVRFQIR